MSSRPSVFIYYKVPPEADAGWRATTGCGRSCVEGAEMFVLRGASEFLRRTRPPLLLSVHPPQLPRHGSTVNEVAAFLREHGYSWSVLARDHEEHWWCEFSTARPIPAA